ncbi:MAG: sialidase family protein [Candidatus Kapabacteria bacterium]|jgi:hypothetical protein|nr:sialidase family protein [Candidatus Kapabacteria bacterium]
MKFLSTVLTILLLFIITSFELIAAPDSVAWSVVGIGGGGGQFTPAVSPHNPNLMFVSCDMSGFYRSTDRGTTWSMSDFRQIYSSTGLATVFSPTDPDKIWDDGRRDGRRYLLSSDDAGLTWNPEWILPGTAADMVCLRDEPLLLLVSIADDGIYKSDNGTDFTKIESIESGSYKLCENADDILIASSDHLYYSSNRAVNFTEFTLGQFVGNTPLGIEMNSGFWFVNTAEALYRSDDEAETWTEVIKSSDFDRGNFKFLRAEQNIVWLTTGGGGKYQSTALKSEDFGLTFEPVFFCNSSWEDTQNLNAAWLTLDFNCGWGGSAIGFDICRSDPNIAVWTDYGRTLATFDRGETWEALYSKYSDEGERSAGKKWTSRGLEVTTSWDMYLDGDITQIAYTDIGGAMSEDQGKTWKSTRGNGIPGEWLNTTYNFEYDSENSTLWGGFSSVHEIIGGWGFNYWNRQGSGGVARSSDKGDTWEALSENGLVNKPVTSITVDYNSPANNSTLFAAVWSD